MIKKEGFPRFGANQVSLSNWRERPFSSWSFHNVREVMPTAEIANAPQDVWALPGGEFFVSEDDLKPEIDSPDTDAMVILKDGHLVFEDYRNGMAARDPHILMSVAKSMTGLLAGTLVENGELDTRALLTDYAPELRGSAYDGATVRHALDMRVGLDFGEDYLATEGPVALYRAASGWVPPPQAWAHHSLTSVQSTLTMKKWQHGGALNYVSPVTDVLGWVFERAASARVHELFSERIWRPMGAEFPAYITLDRCGNARTTGGLCVTARDLARVGQLILQNGARDGRQVISDRWLQDIFENGDRAAWKHSDFGASFPGLDMSYRSKWYIRHAPDRLLHAVGIHGQFLFVDPDRQLVIVWMSSGDTPTNDARWPAVLAFVERVRRLTDDLHPAGGLM